MSIRTRFAPSPTGFLHIGGARTALFCWLAARHAGGRFLLRIEDTDRERSTEEAIDAILEGLSWLGLDWDEGPLFQTSRLERYRQVAYDLVRAGKAYFAYESREELEAMRAEALARGEKPRYNGYYRERNEPERDDPNRVIRFKNPLTGSVVFHDLVKGRVEWRNEELDDLVLIRADGHPTYNFAVVVDDLDMRITDVIRGDDHVNNTPRQINIYEALGARPPRFAHLPMILGPDGTKLSKRHGAVSVLAYREEGFLPHALLNYLVRLGWSYGDQEVFTREEMIRLFSLEGVHRAAARFDPEKLRWLNQYWFKHSDPAEIAPHLEWHLRRLGLDPARGPAPADVVRALADRVRTLAEMAERARVWYQPLPGYDAKAARHLTLEAAALLRELHQRLAALAGWRPEPIEAELRALAAERGVGLGKIAQPLRVAITGSEVSPSIEHTVYLAGREEALARIARAVAEAEARATV